MTDLATTLHSEFRSRFPGTPLLVMAPGRINLIGEHVDYNLGFVLPGAIDKHFIFAIAANNTDRCRVYSSDFRESSEFDLTALVAGPHWVNYFMGVAEGFRRKGKTVHGFDCVFGGTIPAGAGLSSSAALCCGLGTALNELFEAGLSKIELALIAQFSEHEFAGVKCGLMDQYASLFGERDSLLLLDCRSNTHEAVPFPSSQCTIILADTRVKHSLASSAYNDRRAACEEGAAKLATLFPAVTSLRDVTLDQLEKGKSLLRQEVFTRCHYIVTEMERTQQAAQALKSGDLARVGKLMFQTHEGLRSEYEVSCPELDVLASAAAKHPEWVIGARMMGGGFGGCTINLIRPGSEESFKALVSKEYFTSFRHAPEFHTVALAQGTHRMNR
ncbi:MAG: galactokinase [Cyclobacteriaceae bacterium]|nr:galactokinase [Cyclobacteriaceae bacterium]